MKPTPDEQTSYSKRRTILTSLVLAPGAALLASLLAVILMILLRLYAGIPTPVELFGDFYLKHIDVPTFISLLNRYSPHPKTGPLGQALLGMIALGVALGFLYAALVQVKLPASGYRPGKREWLIAGAFALAMTLLGVILFWDELRQNLFGFPIGWSMVLSSLGMLADFCLYAVTLCLAYRTLLPKQYGSGKIAVEQSRRQLLSRAGVAALTVGAAAGTFGVVQSYLGEYANYDGTPTPLHDDKTAAITPNSEHYVVTQNTIDPKPNSAIWRLEVTGLVGNAGSYTYDEVQQLPSTSRAITLECISNVKGGHLMGTAIWQGVTLSSLLARHGGAQSTATHIAFHSVDGYTISLPIKEVLDVDPILAWRMNGAALPERHGFPLRALIPGRYGEEQPKWLTRVEVTDHFVSGLYASQGWYNGTLHTTSRIDRPNGKVPVGTATEVSGIAFAGNRGIQKVEVSTDNAMTWQAATLQPALSEDAWVLWTWQWTPTQTGNYTLAVRATDGTGEVQTSTEQRTVPNGATGYQRVKVQVV